MPPRRELQSARFGRVWFPAVILALLTVSLALPAQNELDREQAESRLAEVLEGIDQLRQRLEDSRTNYKSEQERLRQTDLALQQANLEYRELEQQRQARLAELRELQSRREDYLASLDHRLGQLSEQLRTSYRAGQQSRMKLVLNQDDPVQIGRMLTYYDYLNRAQVEKISGLKQVLKTLDGMQQSIDLELSRLAAVQTEQQEVLDQLTDQRSKREAMLAGLSGQIDDEQSRLRELERDRQDLEALIERLTDVLADIPADLGSHLGVAQQKGRLKMPVAGPVRHAFGQTRAGGMRWQGWLIGSDPGSEVRSIAYGRVAFADWLRGYGLLIIIDHGQGFMSLYGQNESLLHEAGTWVENGEPISVVGSNPGDTQGLYFELRRQGKAVDPAAWVAR